MTILLGIFICLSIATTPMRNAADSAFCIRDKVVNRIDLSLHQRRHIKRVRILPRNSEMELQCLRSE